MLGFREADLQTMQETLDLALELNCEFANVYSAMAYPGSALYELALKEGWRLPERWSGYSQHAIDTLPLPTKHISGAEVLRFRDHAFQVYFNSPRYLEMVRQKFGDPTVQHIQEMTAHTLVRNQLPMADCQLGTDNPQSPPHNMADPPSPLAGAIRNPQLSR